MFGWLSALARAGGDAARREAKRLVLAIIFYSLAGLLILLAVGFMLAGIFMAIEQPLGPIAAAFIMMGGLLVLAIIVFLIASAPGRSRQRRSELSEDLALANEEQPGVAGVAAAFAFGLARGFAKRRKG